MSGRGGLALFGTDGIRGTANVHPMTAEMALSLGQADLDVRSPAQDRPDRLGDVARVEKRAGYLVQERGEQVVVVAVEQEDVHRPSRERPRALQPSESGPDDHHARTFHAITERDSACPNGRLVHGDTT